MPRQNKAARLVVAANLLGHIRLNDSGANGIDADPLGGELQRRRFCESDDRGLVRTVNRNPELGLRPRTEALFTIAPQRSQGMILLSITSLPSGGRGAGGSTGPTSSGVVHKAASICRVNSSPKGLKIAARCAVIWVGWITNHFAGNMAAPVIHCFQAGDALCSAPLRGDRPWTRESLILRLPFWRESVISQGPGRGFECSRWSEPMPAVLRAGSCPIPGRARDCRTEAYARLVLRFSSRHRRWRPLQSPLPCPNAARAAQSWSFVARSLRRTRSGLQHNQQTRGLGRHSGPAREGPALLQGLVICGKCGRSMTLR